MSRNYWNQSADIDSRGVSQDGLTLATFTTSAAIFPPFTVPANFFQHGRKVKFTARGIWAATGTPTYTFRVQATAPAAVTIVTSAAIAVTALTNQSWVWSGVIQSRTAGTAGTLEGLGDLSMGGVASNPQFLPATGTAPAATGAIDTTVAETLQLEIACSVSNAANTVKGIELDLVFVN